MVVIRRGGRNVIKRGVKYIIENEVDWLSCDDVIDDLHDVTDYRQIDCPTQPALWMLDSGVHMNE